MSTTPPAPTSRRIGFLLLLVMALAAGTVACSKPQHAADAAASEHKETGLERIPDADPAKFPKFEDLSGWQNPYFVVREDGVGLVDLANHEVHILTPEQIPAELATLPLSAWPYGRVVLVTQATPKNPSDQAKAELRKNRALLAGTLKELGVQIQEAP